MPLLRMSLVNRLFSIENTEREDFWEGSALVWSKRVSSFYLLVTLSSLIAYAVQGKERIAGLEWYWRVIAILLGFFVSAGPPAWFWLEARAFDLWVRRKHPGDRSKQEPYREVYKINVEFARGFWAAIIAVYAAVLLKW